MSARAPSGSFPLVFSFRVISWSGCVVAEDVLRCEDEGEVKGVMAEEFSCCVARVLPLELGPPVAWPCNTTCKARPAQVRASPLNSAGGSHEPQCKERELYWIELHVRCAFNHQSPGTAARPSSTGCHVLNMVIWDSICKFGLYYLVYVRCSFYRRQSALTLHSDPVAVPC